MAFSELEELIIMVRSKDLNKNTDWIFEGIANWIASIVASVMDAIPAVLLGADMTAMEEYLPP